MSHKLIDLNSDLKRLKEEGYEVGVKGLHLCVSGIPYLNAKKEILRGTLVSHLELDADGRTKKPEDHVIHFIGEHPYNVDGAPIAGIRNASQTKALDEGLVIHHSFSNKPVNGYDNYHHKVTRYAEIICSQAEAVDPLVTPKTFLPAESEESDSVFHYPDTNSSRAEISAIAARLKDLRIAIVGLGGTGSYVLDFVAKTPVGEIHLYDRDIFFLHNAFRSPGASSIEQLRAQFKKVRYLADIYSRMRKGIVSHEVFLAENNLVEMEGMSFVFLCLDDGGAKRIIIEKLSTAKIPFVDVGIGVNAIDEKLTGGVRTTTCTSEKNDHISRRISLGDDVVDNRYSKNIQIAELNALNAALAVVKWKKLFGVYHDLGKEYHSVYEINTNSIINDETIT